MTENEAMERMRSLIAQAVQERQAESWTTVAARTALTSHPAVEVLLALYVAADAVWLDDETTTADEHTAYVSALEDARTVLASLPKEK